jgi:hypothetical protein
MERVRETGKRIGGPRLEKRERFASGRILKRLLDDDPAATWEAPPPGDERTALVTEGVGVTRSLNVKPSHFPLTTTALLRLKKGG